MATSGNVQDLVSSVNDNFSIVKKALARVNSKFLLSVPYRSKLGESSSENFTVPVGLGEDGLFEVRPEDEEIISELTTENKTLIGSINEVNGKVAELTELMSSVLIALANKQDKVNVEYSD